MAAPQKPRSSADILASARRASLNTPAQALRPSSETVAHDLSTSVPAINLPRDQSIQQDYGSRWTPAVPSTPLSVQSFHAETPDDAFFASTQTSREGVGTLFTASEGVHGHASLDHTEQAALDGLYLDQQAKSPDTTSPPATSSGHFTVFSIHTPSTTGSRPILNSSASSSSAISRGSASDDIPSDNNSSERNQRFGIRRMTRPQRVKVALAFLRDGRLSPVDFLIDILDSRRDEFGGYRDGLYKENSTRLGDLMDVIMSDPKGKRKLEEWMELHAVDVVCRAVGQEMDAVKKDFNMSIADVSPEYLRNWDLGANTSNEKAPILQQILHSAAQTDTAKEKNKIKDPHTVRLINLSVYSYGDIVIIAVDL
jgi:hypothetical protein